jgi:hypothetical protein
MISKIGRYFSVSFAALLGAFAFSGCSDDKEDKEDPKQTLEVVDMGFKSGTKWANMNIGANKPEDNGYYFAWGETEGYGSDVSDGHVFFWNTYKWGAGSDNEFKISKYQVPDNQKDGCWYSSDGKFVGDKKTLLDLEDDAAHVILGGDWVMPTADDFQELIDNTTKEWVEKDGECYLKLTSNFNGASIIIPTNGSRDNDKFETAETSGHYWSANLNTKSTSLVNYCGFNKDITRMGVNRRCFGFGIRPVQRAQRAVQEEISNAPANVEAVDLGLPSGVKWANINLGAEKETDYGLFYAYGETIGYGSDVSDGRKFDFASYKWMNEGQSTKEQINKYQIADEEKDCCWYDSEGKFIGDGKSVLDEEDDAVCANWGGKWSMPSVEDLQELMDNTTAEWTTVDGIPGMCLTSKTNSNSIFMPAAGHRSDVVGVGPLGLSGKDGMGTYMTKTLRLKPDNVEETQSYYWRGYFFMQKKGGYLHYDLRSSGASIRPVYKD